MDGEQVRLGDDGLASLGQQEVQEQPGEIGARREFGSSAMRDTTNV